MKKQITESLLVRNTFWMFLGQGGKILLQAIYFIIIARSLGPDGYGSFVGVVALVSILAPFSSWGSGNLLIKNVSRNESLFSGYWGNALVTTFASGTVLVVGILSISYLLLPRTIPFLLIVLVSLSDMLFARILDVCGQAYLAFQKSKRTAQLHVFFSFTRLIAAMIFFLSDYDKAPTDWGWLYLISTFVSAVISTMLVCIELGKPSLQVKRILPELKEGLYFSISLSAQGIYNDIDKTMLTRMSTLEATGIFSAAYRLVDVSFIPIRSLLYASYSSFFQHGINGIRGCLIFARKIIPISIFYSLFIGGVLYLIAPLIPLILGEEYKNAIDAIRLLAVIPFLRVFHYFAADTLTGAGFQGVRSSIQLMIAGFSVLLNILLIPLFSWYGAALASIISNLALAIWLWITVGYFYQRQINNSTGKVTKGV